MRHLVSKPKLSRTRNQRHALVKNLLSDFFLHKAIVTTEAKAKFIKPQVEHSITIAKKGTVAAYRQLLRIVGSNKAVKVLVDAIAPSFTRTSGYTRLTPVSLRRGDNTLMVKISLVEKDQEVAKKVIAAKKEIKVAKTDKSDKKVNKKDTKSVEIKKENNTKIKTKKIIKK